MRNSFQSCIFGMSLALGFAHGSPAQAQAPASVSALAQLVPSNLRGGKISAAVGETNPPIYFRDADGKLAGLLIDMAEHAAGLLGVTYNMQPTSFEAVIPGINSGKFDVGLTGANITPERVKLADLVPYYNTSTVLMQWKATKPIGPNVSDMCGMNVGSNQGSVVIDLIKAASDKDCVAAGKPPVQVSVFPDQPSIQLAARAGRIDAVVVSRSGAAYAMSQSKDWSFSGPTFAESPVGIVFQKNSSLAAAYVAAFNAMIKDGTYQRLLQKWQMTGAGLPMIEMNDTTLRK